MILSTNITVLPLFTELYAIHIAQIIYVITGHYYKEDESAPDDTMLSVIQPYVDTLFGRTSTGSCEIYVFLYRYHTSVALCTRNKIGSYSTAIILA